MQVNPRPALSNRVATRNGHALTTWPGGICDDHKRLADARGRNVHVRETTSARRARHGGDQPPAGLGRRGRDAGGRRQRGRCRDRRIVHAEVWWSR